jgi:hypothetical protein
MRRFPCLAANQLVAEEGACSMEEVSNNNYVGPRKYSILLVSIKNYRKCRVLMRTQHTNIRPSDISVQKVKERKRISEEGCA